MTLKKLVRFEEPQGLPMADANKITMCPTNTPGHLPLRVNSTLHFNEIIVPYELENSLIFWTYYVQQKTLKVKLKNVYLTHVTTTRS